jgi:beta-lactamase class A
MLAITAMFLGAVLLGPALATAAEPAVAVKPEDLSKRIQERIDRHPGVATVALRHVESGFAFSHRGDEPMPTASLIKLAVMIEAYRQAEEGKIDLQTMIPLRDDDKVPGSGILTSHFSAGATLSLRDYLHLMIAFSDNTATNVVVDAIGLRSTSDTMQSWGWPNTKLHSKVFRRDTSLFPERSKQFGLGSTTAHEMREILQRLHERELVSRAASEAMLTHLRKCEDRSTFRRDLARSITVAHKTGAVTGVRTDAGLIEMAGSHILLCVLTKDNPPPNAGQPDEGESLCADIAKLAVDAFPASPDKSGKSSSKLQEGDSGDEVLRIQRRLNMVLDPRPQLAVDGEFGPMTRAAVERFQKQVGLPATGAVDGPTRDKLFGDR